jgi:hypothetical protein
METTLGNWCCPLCNSPFIVTEYPSKRGYRLTCKGTDEIPHRLRLYLEGYRKDAAFLVTGSAVELEVPAPKTSRAKELLARAAALAGEEKQAA